MLNQSAFEDFNRAYRRAFWRRIRAWFTGEKNELLPYDEVRRELPLEGQREIGLRTIPIEKIVGSVGRYRDFDRAFLPTQRTTSARWISIKRAEYQAIELPPIEAYKIGDVYFVKDGNHRVSVARERRQTFIDAYVIEIDVPIKLTADMQIDDVRARREYAEFMQRTGLLRLRPDADLLLSMPGQYDRLLEHINTHRWYLSLERQVETPYDEALLSWYDSVYQPLVAVIQEHNLLKAFPERTLTDLYLWVSEYQWLLREEHKRTDEVGDAVERLLDVYKVRDTRRVIRQLRQTNWLDQMILTQDREAFLAATHIHEIRPQADIVLSLPGKYEHLLQHINVHHYYLGQERQADVPYDEAVASFYDNVYRPLLELIREQGVMRHFPNRTEHDLCLWILDHHLSADEALAELTPDS
jgi:hypothetical protein